MSQTNGGPHREVQTTAAPRWVKVFGIIGLLLVVLFIILHLTGLAPTGHTPPSSSIQHGVTRP
jgi:hypothetical protein